ncbi:MAG: Stk1 family PASTA domain-containing Ser/Thr kinase [Clostridiales bacterium]|jgi:serine/threonine-protein kinase|nr:Stk1 family PASTA domain-containing Ser/Thr kinase [Clostridiales bacterium]
MKLEPGTVIAGRYEIIERIGMGGMAVVYKALDRKLVRAVTVKVMREEHMADEEFIARFQIEARAAASLSNANIVNVYDVGQDASMNYIIMEYIDGMTLKELIQAKAPFSNEEALGVAVQIASALADAHLHGVIHRDIKPQNILVTNQGIVKVTDFGIARAAGSSTLTTGRNTMGSVHYFSPEQARGVFVDQKSDIYSLGIVMFEMTTGHLPFEGETNVAVAMKHINDPLPDMKHLNPNITDSLEGIIRKAAHKNSALRYQSANDLISDLKWCLSLEVEDAHPSPSQYKPRPSAKMGSGEQQVVKPKALPEAPYKKSAKQSPPAEESLDMNAATEEEKAYERKIIIAAVITAAIIIVLISSLGLFFYESNKPVPVHPPLVKGMEVEEARALASEYGLRLQTEQKYDDDADAGIIISQNETPDAFLLPGEALHVTVSMGTNKINAPDLRNKTFGEAEAILAEQAIQYTYEREYSETVLANYVISQYPAPDELISPDSSISFVVSLGPPTKISTVPDLTGKSESEAIEILQGLGIAIGLSSKAPHDTIPAGCIITQTLKPNSQVIYGNAECSYVISTGPLERITPTRAPTATLAPVELKSMILVIQQPQVTEDAATLHLRVNKIISGGAGENILDEVIPVENFPYSLRVSGEGEVYYQVYLVRDDGTTQLVAEQPVNFDEPAGIEEE